MTSTDAAGNVSVISGIEDGNRLPTVPKFQAVAAATYQWADAWRAGSATSTGTYQHVGSRFTQVGDQEAGFGTVNLLSFGPNSIGGPLTQGTFTFDPELPAYDLINLRLGVREPAMGRGALRQQPDRRTSPCWRSTRSAAPGRASAT